MVRVGEEPNNTSKEGDMATKNSSVLVSEMGRGLETIRAIIIQLEDMGGSDEDLSFIRSRPGLAAEIATMIRCEAKDALVKGDSSARRLWAHLSKEEKSEVVKAWITMYDYTSYGKEAKPEDVEQKLESYRPYYNVGYFDVFPIGIHDRLRKAIEGFSDGDLAKYPYRMKHILLYFAKL